MSILAVNFFKERTVSNLLANNEEDLYCYCLTFTCMPCINKVHC